MNNIILLNILLMVSVILNPCWAEEKFTTDISLDSLRLNGCLKRESCTDKKNFLNLTNRWVEHATYKQQKKQYLDLPIPSEDASKKPLIRNNELLTKVIERKFKAGLYADVIRLETLFSKNDKPSWKTLYYLGMSYYEMGEFNESICFFTKILESEHSKKGRGKWNLLLGNAYSKTGNHDLAKIHYKATLCYIPSPWALVRLSAYAVQEGDNPAAYKYLDQLVEVCDVPNLIQLVRADEFRKLYHEGEFINILEKVKDKCLVFFDECNAQGSTKLVRMIRIKSLTCFCVLLVKYDREGNEEGAANIKGWLHDLGFSDLDINLELVRLYSSIGDCKFKFYLNSAMKDSSYPFSDSELLAYCQWLKENSKDQVDHRFGFETRLYKLVEEASSGDDKDDLCNKLSQ